MLTIYLCFLAGGAVLPFISFIMGFLSGGLDTDIDSNIDMNTDIHSEINLGSGSSADINVTPNSVTNLDTGTDLNTGIDMNTGTDINTGAEMNTGTDMNSGSGVDSLISIGLIPTSFLAVSALTLTFGATGALMTIGNVGKLLTFLLSLVIGYLASVVVQTIINSLKKIQTTNSGVGENELLLYNGTVIDTILPGQMGTVSFVTLAKERVSYPAKCDDKSLKLETGRIVKVLEFQNGIFIVEPKNKYE